LPRPAKAAAAPVAARTLPPAPHQNRPVLKVQPKQAISPPALPPRTDLVYEADGKLCC